jgi:hypothetical protein
LFRWNKSVLFLLLFLFMAPPEPQAGEQEKGLRQQIDEVLNRVDQMEQTLREELRSLQARPLPQEGSARELREVKLEEYRLLLEQLQTERWLFQQKSLLLQRIERGEIKTSELPILEEQLVQSISKKKETLRRDLKRIREREAELEKRLGSGGEGMIQ